MKYELAVTWQVPSTRPKPLIAAELAIYFFVFCTGIILNVSVLRVINRLRTRSVSSVFIRHLAIADLLQCVFGLFPIILGDLLRIVGPGSWIIPRAACLIVAFLSQTSKSTSFFVTSVISLDRMIIIRRPFGKRCKRSNAFMATLFLMFAAQIVMVPPLFGISGFRESFYVNTCTMDYCNKGAETIYLKTAILFTYFASFGTSLFCYYKVYQVTIRQSKKKRALNSSSLRLHEDELTSTPTPELGINGHSNGIGSQRNVKSSTQGTVRRTPRERKRANKNSLHMKGGRGGSGSSAPSRSASMRSLASLSSLWTGQTLDIRRTRKTIMITIMTAMLPLPLNIWGFFASFFPACGEMTHPPLLLLANFVVIFNPLVYGFLNHALRKKLLQLWVFRCFVSNQVGTVVESTVVRTPVRSRHKSECDASKEVPAPPHRGLSRRRTSSDSGALLSKSNLETTGSVDDDIDVFSPDNCKNCNDAIY